MHFDTILLWFVVVSCTAALLRTLANIRVFGADWMIVHLLILTVTGAGGWWHFPPAIYAGGILWTVWVLVPALLSRLYLSWFFQQRYRAARNLAQIVGWLHPAGGWRRQPEVLRALELAQAGEIATAVEILQRHQDAQGPVASGAMAALCRLTHQWAEFNAWQEMHRPDLNREPQLIPLTLRARGEVGDLAGLVNLFDRYEKQIARLEPAIQRHLCRLILFAFCGRRQPVERLFAGPLAMMPASARELWLATTDLAAGRAEEARRKLCDLLPSTDPVTQRAMERRLSHPLAVAEQVLGPGAKATLGRAEEEHHHEEQFGARPSLFSRMAFACQAFIALNSLVFLVEVNSGGSTQIEVLFRLGALVPEAIQRGEWWRLVAANFLHFGPLHLVMNMFGLWVLGPFVEFALGLRRFVVVYLVSGIASMGAVFLLLRATGKDEILVGASACVMGLVGSTGAILLRGWRRQKARIAFRRLISVLFIIVLQTLFDWVVPQVSMAAHLSGAIIGFLTTTLLTQGCTRAEQPEQPDKK